MAQMMTQDQFMALLAKHTAATPTQWKLKGRMRLLRCGDSLQHCPITFVCKHESPPWGAGVYRAGEYFYAANALGMSREDGEAIAAAADQRALFDMTLRDALFAICQPKETV